MAIMTYFFRVLHQVFGFLYSDLRPSLMVILFSFFDPVCLWVFLSTALKKINSDLKLFFSRRQKQAEQWFLKKQKIQYSKF